VVRNSCHDLQVYSRYTVFEKYNDLKYMYIRNARSLMRCSLYIGILWWFFIEVLGRNLLYPDVVLTPSLCTCLRQFIWLIYLMAKFLALGAVTSDYNTNVGSDPLYSIYYLSNELYQFCRDFACLLIYLHAVSIAFIFFIMINQMCNAFAYVE